MSEHQLGKRFLTLVCGAAAVLGLAVAPATAAVPEPAAPAALAAPPAFTHPGVFVSRQQLDWMRARVQAGTQPQAAAYQQMNSHGLASLSRQPKPRAIVECGSYSNPNLGCTDERQDAIAAYTNALNWYITRDTRYAQKAIQLMDAWSAVIKDHTNSNARLQTGWAGTSWAKAAEIIRHTGAGWAQSGVDRFSAMLRTVYLPEIINGVHSNGNWELVMMEAAMGMAVFLEDRGAYDQALRIYRTRVPAFLYLPSDGALPRTVPGSGLSTPAQIRGYWHNPNTFPQGLAQETCRDFTHTGYGLASIASFAETTRHQGQDLYPEIEERLRHSLGLHARYELGQLPATGLCRDGAIKKGIGPVLEVGFNALANRRGVAMASTQQLVEQSRPAGTNILFVAWETLTHGGNPN